MTEKVAVRLKLPASEAGAVVNTVFDSMATSLSAGERIDIPGFGVFEVREDEGDEERDPTAEG